MYELTAGTILMIFCFFLSLLTVLISISSGIPNHSASIQVHIYYMYLSQCTRCVRQETRLVVAGINGSCRTAHVTTATYYCCCSSTSTAAVTTSPSFTYPSTSSHPLATLPGLAIAAETFTQNKHDINHMEMHA